ncbi:hypothetical protein BDZ94DRAFT_813034 [Collybia nuda]|uniref:C3H1-type domain-containing protein n=1 Tax=Collybia nuda TaxID=64659 RepID=A0A9P5Y2D2_9AGAR|nr:hypothetical protein BDZ94DRAFT_813034 [Collybia nuda]
MATRTVCRYNSTETPCKYGDKCRFLHTQTISISNPNPHTIDTQSYDKLATTRSVKLCFQFASSGSCGHGIQCKYPHLLPLNEDSIAAPEPKLCRYFTKGIGCRFGARCRSRHIISVDDVQENLEKPRKRRQRVRQKLVRQKPDINHLKAFFVQFPGFVYDKTQAVTDEFFRLCHELWPRDNLKKRTARKGFKKALVMEFNRIFGIDVNDINNWRSLCRILNLKPENWDSLDDCRETVQNAHVNLIDLVDFKNHIQHDGDSCPVIVNFEVFETEDELADYTIATSKYFPKEHAKAGGLLRFLLRRILNR